MKKIYLYISLLGLLFFANIPSAMSQVNVVASAGVPFAPYPTLNAAFAAINAGTHQGVIRIGISASVVEPGPAVLHSNGSGTALYQSVIIGPIVDGVSISGPTATGRGLIEFNGCDSVVVEGDNPNTGGVNRNLTIQNTAVNTITFTSCVRFANSAAVTTSNDVAVRNCILIGSATSRNAVGITSTAGSENTTFGVYAGGNGGATATTAPAALTSVTANTAPAGTTINNFSVTNCSVISCARGIVFLGANATVSTGVTVSNNTIGDQTALVGTPPFTSPANTVYTKGIYVGGTTAVTITGNSIRNILTYVGILMTGIELPNNIGAGAININNNTINGMCQNNSLAFPVKAILISNAGAPYTISGNTITNIQGILTGFAGATTTVGVEVNTTAASGTIELNNISQVYNRNPGTTAAYGINVLGGNNVTMRNNFISDINQNITGGFSFDPLYGVFGIRINAGTGHRMYYNSINLFGALLGTANSNLLTSCIAVAGTGQTGLDIRNNILANNLTGGTTSIAHVSIYLPSGGTSAMNLTLNNNTYYCGTDVARQGIGQAGLTAGTNFYLPGNFNPATTAPATNMRAYTSTLSVAGTNDNASFASNVVPPFISNTDLHINNGAINAVDVDAKATPIAGITTDIDANVRDAVTPDIGGDEFSAPNCSTATGGTITPASYTRCSGQTVTLTSTGATGGAGITYQWMVGATSGGPYVNVSGGSGATTTSYTSGALTAGTYYYVLQTTCSFGPLTGLSNEATVTVNANPSASASTNSPICVGDTILLNGTTDIGTSFTWSGPNGFSSTSQNDMVLLAPLAAAGTYSFTAIANGCSSLVATTNVIVGVAPTGATASVSNDTVCNGTPIDLNSSANPYSIILLTENFNSGAPTWTRFNSSTGGTPANAAWTDRPNGFVYAGGTAYSTNDASQFIQSNSDAQGSGSTTRTNIQSPVFSTSGYSNVNVNFYHFYRDIGDAGDSAIVEASLDGISWTVANAFTATTGTENNFTNSNVALPALFDNQPNVYVRFRYIGTWDWYWSIDNVTISSNSTNFTYNWTSAPAGFTSTSQNPTGVIPTTTTAYTVAITNIFGCSATAGDTVTVLSPAVSYTASPNDTICAGDNVTLSGTGAVSYSWTGGITDGVAFTPPSSGSYTVTGTDIGGCTNTASAFIQVNSLPVVTVSGDTTLCPGDTVTLTGTSGGTSQWYLNGSPIGGATSNTYMASLPGHYNMVKTNLNGCADSSVVGLDIISYPNPVVSYTVSPNDTVCAGTMLTLSGTGASSYGWTGGITDAVPFAASGSTTYTVTGTDVNGCTNTASAPIVVNTSPTVGYTVSPNDTICPGGSVTLSGTGAVSYSWTGGITNAVSFTPASSGTYTVTGTGANGCSSTASAPIVVGTNPTVNLGADIVQANPPAVLDAGAGFTSYLWSTSESTQTISVNTNGTYIVTVTNIFGCTDSDTIQVNFTSGISNPDGSTTTMMLYPNPNTGPFNVRIDNLETNNLVLDILDMTGRVVYNQYVGSVSGNTILPFDLTNLRVGTYVLRMTANGNSAQLRFIISN